MLERPRGIGGSDAAAAIGLDPYKSPVRLWLEATGREEREPAGEAAEWGTLLQPLIAAKLADDYLVSICDDTFEQTEPLPMFGHIDALVRRDGITGVAEIKTCSLRLASQWDDDQVPLQYAAQGMHYLAVTGLPYVVYACLIGGQRFVVRRLERDETVIAQLVEAERRFWQHVEDDTPPPPDSATAADLAALYGVSVEEVVTLDDAPELAANLRMAREARKTAEQFEEECENQVKARMGSASVAMLNGRKVASWQSQSSKRVDVSRLKEELPDVYTHYLRESESRPFRVFS